MLAVNPIDRQFLAKANSASADGASVPLDLNALFTAEKVAALPALIGLSVRQSCESDLPFLADVYGAARADEMAATGWDAPTIQTFIDMQFDLQHHYYREHYADAEFLVITWHGMPIGRLYWWCGGRGKSANLMDISLLDAWRGRGIGSAILSILTAYADDNEIAITLYVEPDNPALRLYQRMDFAAVGDNNVYRKMQRLPRTIPS